MRAAFVCLGAGLLCVMQLHLSAALLGVIAVAVLGLLARHDRRAIVTGLPWLALGTALGGLTLVPTLAHDGLRAFSAFGGSNVHSEPASLLSFPILVARFFSFGSFEIARFIGGNTGQRLDFLFQFPWAAPFALIAGTVGVAQTGWLVVSLFRSQPDVLRWPAVRTATAILLLLAAAAFMLSVKGPASHVLYALLPAVLIYAFYCWAPVLEKPVGRWAAVALLVCGAVTLTALGMRNVHLRSLYTIGHSSCAPSSRRIIISSASGAPTSGARRVDDGLDSRVARVRPGHRDGVRCAPRARASGGPVTARPLPRKSAWSSSTPGRRTRGWRPVMTSSIP